MRVVCTHKSSIYQDSHVEDIPDSDLLNPTQLLSRRCQVCGMPLVLDSQFLVVKHLGSGGFSQTWIAIDLNQTSAAQQGVENLPKRVVKQFFPKSTALQPEEYQDLKRRFEEEAYRLSSLDHPQIPKLIKYFKIDQLEDELKRKECVYIVQEYIEGKHLKDLDFNVSESQIIDLLCQILEILIYIHRKGIIHRDIKPENIIYSENNKKYYLIDFGAAKETSTSNTTYVPHQSKSISSDSRSNKLSFSSSQSTYVPRKISRIPQRRNKPQETRIGTPGFVAPEQWKERQAVFASDQYSLAATCISLLKRNDESDFEELIHSPSWHQYLSNQYGISMALVEILAIMLSPNPEERYQSAFDVLMALNQLPTAYAASNPAAEKKLSLEWGGLKNRLLQLIQQYFYSPSRIVKHVLFFSMSGLVGFATHHFLYPSSEALNSPVLPSFPTPSPSANPTPTPALTPLVKQTPSPVPEPTSSAPATVKNTTTTNSQGQTKPAASSHPSPTANKSNSKPKSTSTKVTKPRHPQPLNVPVSPKYKPITTPQSRQKYTPTPEPIQPVNSRMQQLLEAHQQGTPQRKSEPSTSSPQPAKRKRIITRIIRKKSKSEIQTVEPPKSRMEQLLEVHQQGD